MSFLIYGANGYTGQLIVELSSKKGLKPTLAGRNAAKVSGLANQFGFDYLVFGLDKHDEICTNLQNFDLVLNCAGPFTRTAKPIVEACLATKTHYLDITGEIEVFELLKTYNQQALDKGIVILPGVGFDVVPTDCMAKLLHEQMPDATHLELAFMTVGGSISHGTLTTVVENLGKSGFVRENHQITPKPTGHKGKWIEFIDKKSFAMTIPWGDISTAHHTTGIPNIETYFAGISPTVFYMNKLQWFYNPILKLGFVKRMIQRYIDKNINGPTKAQLENGKSLVWGKVSNAKGESKEAVITTIESYKLTAEMSLTIVEKVLKLNNPAGYHTPAGLFGWRLIIELENSEVLPRF